MQASIKSIESEVYNNTRDNRKYRRPKFKTGNLVRTSILNEVFLQWRYYKLAFWGLNDNNVYRRYSTKILSRIFSWKIRGTFVENNIFNKKETKWEYKWKIQYKQKESLKMTRKIVVLFTRTSKNQTFFRHLK